MSTLNWFDMVTTEEDTKETQLLRMSAAEWKAEGQRIIRTWRGDLRHCINFLDEMDARRAAVVVPEEEVQRVRTEFDIDFALWKDMIDEPSKYGSDIGEWLELDAKLRQGSGRWRLGAFWDEKEQEIADAIALRAEVEEFVRRRDAATRIQAAVRGHQARVTQPFRDCCMCLSHRISPLSTDVGCMCRGCAEQGPYEEETGPIADPWSEFRGDFIDLAPVQSTCYHCFSTLDEGQTGDFCDSDCRYAYMREAWRDD